MYTQPSIYKWADIVAGRFEGRRLQKNYNGSRENYIEGGMHLTHATYLPNLILKTITATESRHVQVENKIMRFHNRQLCSR